MKCNAEISLEKSLTIILYAYVMLVLVKGRKTVVTFPLVVMACETHQRRKEGGSF